MSGSSLSESESESKSLPVAKTKKKTPNLKTKSPKKHDEPKKMTTKQMLMEALSDLKSKKGVSLYAVKKHITEKYDIEMKNKEHILKKVLKNEIESGSIVKTTGNGASGSFKLAPKVKTKTDKPEKKVPKSVQKTEESKEKSLEKIPKKTEESRGKTAMKTTKKKEEKSSKTAANKTQKNTAKPKQLFATKTPPVIRLKSTDELVPKKLGRQKKSEAEKSAKTSGNKSSILKRKSLGSIIKAPKMKPIRAKAIKE